MLIKFFAKHSAAFTISGLMAVAPITGASAFVSPRINQAVWSGQSDATPTDVAFRGRGIARGGHRFGGRGFARGGRGLGRGRHFGYRRGYGHRGGYGYGGYGVGAGLAAGALIGGALAATAAASSAGNSVAYCESRFKSYNPATGTYRGYDGLDHPCP